jgi:quinol monooxygenase YgiN
MELVIFARFHARDGQEDAVAAALREQVPGVWAEPGCLAIGAYRSTRAGSTRRRSRSMPSCGAPSFSWNACKS